MRYWVIEDGDVVGEIKIQGKGYFTDSNHGTVLGMVHFLNIRSWLYQFEMSTEEALIPILKTSGTMFSGASIMVCDDPMQVNS